MNFAAGTGEREACPPAAALQNPLGSHSSFKALFSKRQLQPVGRDELSSVTVLGDQGFGSCLFTALPSAVGIIHISWRDS